MSIACVMACGSDIFDIHPFSSLVLVYTLEMQWILDVHIPISPDVIHVNMFQMYIVSCNFSFSNQ